MIPASGRLACGVNSDTAMTVHVAIPKPLSKAQPSRREVRTLEQLTLQLGRRPRLLLAEDDEELRWALTELFKDFGYDVRSLARGEQLLERVAFSLLLEDEGSTPDVILTDVRLPNFNGLDVIEGMRRAGWNIPVLIMSAFADGALAARVAALGQAVFFQKPLDIEGLLAAAHDAAATYAAVIQHRSP
jgi:DNA-binding NtrC family response regulator